MPGWDGVDSGVVVDEAGSVVVMDRDAVVAVLSVEVEVRGAVDNEEVDVLVEDEEVEGWSWKEMYREDLEFQVAVVTGRAGGASNKADWSLQQTRSRKQQCVVLLSFPLRQGVTTIPWRSTEKGIWRLASVHRNAVNLIDCAYQYRNWDILVTTSSCLYKSHGSFSHLSPYIACLIGIRRLMKSDRSRH